MRNVVILCLLVVFFPSVAFSQLTAASDEALASDSETEALLDRYYDELQKLSKKFAKRYEVFSNSRIVINGIGYPNIETWELKYFQPLFERSKQAMQTVSDCDDYLSVWENKIPQRLVAAMQAEGNAVKLSGVNYPGVGPEYGSDSPLEKLHLLTYYTLAVVNDQRDEILKDTVYENSERGAKIRESRLANGHIRNPWGPIGYQKEYREMYERIKLWYAFPPRLITEIDGETTFDASWYAMAIYSFKNERSENILYEIINDPASEPKLADWAVYYLALSPNSARFLPKVEKDLQEKIASFQKEFPQKGSALSNMEGDTRKPYLTNFRSLFKSASDRYYYVAILGNPEKPGENAIQRYFALNLIRRLRILKQSLEFNEKVPENEKERFEIVRREFAISWALTPKETISGPVVCAGLKKGEERFRIYMAEYEPPLRGELWRYPVFYLRDADSSNPQDQWDAKAFYERELARKDYYSEVQIEYIQKQLEMIDKNEKQRIIMEQREREEERNK